jgi:hypothetical protein
VGAAFDGDRCKSEGGRVDELARVCVFVLKPPRPRRGVEVDSERETAGGKALLDEPAADDGHPKRRRRDAL